MSAMEELEGLLQSLQALKPPGATKTKIEAITSLCINNVQSDSMIVQKLFTQFKKSAATHKLGVLYVLDSVTRQWMEKVRQSGQVVAPTASEGTFASGVYKVTEVLPTLMNDIIQTAPENHREKISKLLDIWERGQTFPLDKLRGFKQKLNDLQTQKAVPQSYTPPGSPPKNGFVASLGVASQPRAPQAPQAPAAPAAPAVPDTAAILSALANFGKPNPTTFPSNGIVAAPTAPAASVAPAPPPQFAYPQNVAPPPLPFLPPPPVLPAGQAAPVTAPAGQPDLMNQLFTAIASGLIPHDQAVQLIATIAATQSAAAAPAVPPPQAPTQTPTQPSAAPANPPPRQNGTSQNTGNTDRYDGGSRYRGRSRSPDYDRRRASPNRRSPPNRRDSPTYGVYNPNTANDSHNNGHYGEYDRGRGRGRNRGGRNDYRQRTPPPPRRLPSPGGPRGNEPKYLEWDRSLPRDHIKVLSRTLFVGGANATEAELRSIFNRFGKVQTCIVNHDKHHAFVKMVNRKDALSAKQGMDDCQDHEVTSKARQTRWGVGFGPRDCSDYNTGISVIPISRLTDADLKWVVSAEYGGTGGQQIEPGMVIEEPDIEIGAGVSSKAISRRVPPDMGGRGRGGHNFAPRGGPHDGPRFRGRADRGPEPRHHSPRPDAAIGVPPPVPGFGFQLPGF